MTEKVHISLHLYQTDGNSNIKVFIMKKRPLLCHTYHLIKNDSICRYLKAAVPEAWPLVLSDLQFEPIHCARH